jgi:hypothetical protein
MHGCGHHSLEAAPVLFLCGIGVHEMRASHSSELAAMRRFFVTIRGR